MMPRTWKTSCQQTKYVEDDLHSKFSFVKTFQNKFLERVLLSGTNLLNYLVYRWGGSYMNNKHQRISNSRILVRRPFNRAPENEGDLCSYFQFFTNHNTCTMEYICIQII